MTNEHTSLEKYTPHFIRNGCERVMCERWVGDWTNCNILTPNSFVFSSTSSSFCWAAQSGVLRAHSPLLGLILSTASYLQLTDSNLLTCLWPRGYIIVWHPPASCGRHICTQFNPSTVKAIPWYHRPDAPVSWSTAESEVSMLQYFNKLNILPETWQLKRVRSFKSILKTLRLRDSRTSTTNFFIN